MSAADDLRTLTAAIHRAERDRLALCAQRDAVVRRCGLGPRALARVLDVSPATAARVLARAMRTE